MSDGAATPQATVRSQSQAARVIESADRAVMLLRDLPLMITDRSFNVDGSFRYRTDLDRGFRGDTILVKPGTYAEALKITTDDLTLKGSRGTVLTMPDDAEPCFVFDPEAPPTLEGICVLGEFSPEFEVIDPVADYAALTIEDSVKAFEGLRLAGVMSWCASAGVTRAATNRCSWWTASPCGRPAGEARRRRTRATGDR